jgi:calcium-dependent protein kinase
MLCDPTSRLTAEEVLQHEWVANLAPNSQDVVLELNVTNLASYKNFNHLKKAALTYIASRLKDDDIKTLREIFNSIDKNQDGTLTLEEMKKDFLKLLVKILILV